MRTSSLKLFIFSAGAAALISSCKNGGGSFQTDPKTGVTYRFIKHDESGAKGTDSSFAKVVMAYYLKAKNSDADSLKAKDGKDSNLFDSHKRGGDSSGTLLQAIPLKATFKGSLEEGLMMMAAGDSAEFLVNADSLYTKTFHFPPDRLPPGVTPNTVYVFRVKLTKFITKGDIMAERQKAMMQQQQKAMALKATEAPKIADYIAKNHYEKVKPTEDSIFILEDEKGKGKAVAEGDSIEVGYRGTLLDGTEFDKSDKGPGHKTIKILYTKNAQLIQGWIKVLGMMNEGEKVKVLIPSKMGYGMQQASQIILPFSPLLFDMQVVSVKKNKK